MHVNVAGTILRRFRSGVKENQSASERLRHVKEGCETLSPQPSCFTPSQSEPDYFNRIAGSPSNTQVRRMSVFVTAAFALVAASPMVTVVPPNNWR